MKRENAFWLRQSLIDGKFGTRLSRAFLFSTKVHFVRTIDEEKIDGPCVAFPRVSDRDILSSEYKAGPIDFFFEEKYNHFWTVQRVRKTLPKICQSQGFRFLSSYKSDWKGAARRRQLNFHKTFIIV